MRVALAYSGGLDTSVAARWLAETRNVEVTAVAVDVGQALDARALAERAAAAGAELRVVDVRDEFVTEACWPALYANARYEGKYPLVSALARPLIAARVVDVAREIGAGAVAHGCTGKGNDQVRFETTFAALAPDLQIMAPVREAAMSRDQAREHAARWSIPIADEARTYSVDENLWGRTIECGPLEDPWTEPPAEVFALTAGPGLTPAEPAEVVVAFEHGLPVELDGERLRAADLVARLGALAGRHGFGRVDMVENRVVGIKSREIYEVPGALALILAHGDLEDLTLERDLAHEKAGLERRWAELAYAGQWHGPLHAALRAFMASTQADVSGEVRLRFHHGACTVTGRRSPRALYDLSLATYAGAADRFDHRHAEGFVRLWSLPIRSWAARNAAGDEAVDRPTLAEPAGAAPAAEPAAAEPPAAASDPPGPRTNGTTADVPLWGGRFSSPPSAGAAEFARSIGFDLRLAPYDAAATAAHAEALAAAGVLTGEEVAAITSELGRLAAEIATGAFEPSDTDEDVHSAIERALTERLGPAGAKIHAGRSRNDLVVADLRRWSMDAADDLAARVGALAAALADRAEEHGAVVMPGYTHLQRAQPVLLAHHLLAHGFPLARDAARLRRARETADVSPLGAGALAGSTIPLPVEDLAAGAGFSRLFDNSIDAVADRDFVLELLSACVIVAVHLSRLAEDLVLWSTEEFGFARLDEGHATGSSMMPQKRNPDVAELCRAKAGRVLGDLVAVAAVLKGLPLAYDRDLQEDKEPLFDACDTLSGALRAMTQVVRGLSFDADRMAAAAGGSLLATDLAEHLVRGGLPFRDAHRLMGTIVAHLERQGRTLADVPAEEWPRLSPLLGSEVSALMSPRAAIERRLTPGGTGPEAVARQLVALRSRLESLRSGTRSIRV